MRLAFVPGFSQPASTWDRVIAALPEKARRDARAVDVPDGLDFVATASAIGASSGPACYIGYSMGGRLALRLAIDRPDLVTRLVLVSTGLGILDPAQREARIALDRERAATIHALGVPGFLDQWLAQPLFSTLSREDAMIDERAATMTAAQLANQMVALGQGAMAPLHDRLASITVPTTVVVGTADARYTAIGNEIATQIPDAALVSLDGGHALPLECPAALAAVIGAIHDAIHDATA
ncbi:MAG: alpha/beta fold hydrolase [Acidimicrobiia bacterium]|nr:alpha/beta fold hydrolase [Acidimicrobiia bacterium]